HPPTGIVVLEQPGRSKRFDFRSRAGNLPIKVPLMGQSCRASSELHCRPEPIMQNQTSRAGNGERQCGTCTACCDGWLKIEVYGRKVDRGKPCPFSAGDHCTIYPTRPQDPCREFICGWLVRNSPLPEWMRPDKSDLILLASNFSWRGLPVDVAVPVGD